MLSCYHDVDKASACRVEEGGRGESEKARTGEGSSDPGKDVSGGRLETRGEVGRANTCTLLMVLT